MSAQPHHGWHERGDRHRHSLAAAGTLLATLLRH